MPGRIYRFTFDKSVPLLDAEMSLHLAILAAEGLFGEARVRMEAGYHVDQSHRLITVDGTGCVGACIVRIFTAFLIREFGPDAFEVRRVPATLASGPVQEAA